MTLLRREPVGLSEIKLEVEATTVSSRTRAAGSPGPGRENARPTSDGDGALSVLPPSSSRSRGNGRQIRMNAPRRCNAPASSRLPSVAGPTGMAPVPRSFYATRTQAETPCLRAIHASFWILVDPPPLRLRRRRRFDKVPNLPTCTSRRSPDDASPRPRQVTPHRPKAGLVGRLLGRSPRPPPRRIGGRGRLPREGGGPLAAEMQVRPFGARGRGRSGGADPGSGASGCPGLVTGISASVLRRTWGSDERRRGGSPPWTGDHGRGVHDDLPAAPVQPALDAQGVAERRHGGRAEDLGHGQVAGHEHGHRPGAVEAGIPAEHVPGVRTRGARAAAMSALVASGWASTRSTSVAPAARASRRTSSLSARPAVTAFRPSWRGPARPPGAPDSRAHWSAAERPPCGGHGR